MDLLQKLIQGELAGRRRQNMVQPRSFTELLEDTLRRYQSWAIEAAQVIEALIQLAQDMREANARGEKLGVWEDELAFYEHWEPTTAPFRSWETKLCGPLPKSWSRLSATTSPSTEL